MLTLGALRIPIANKVPITAHGTWIGSFQTYCFGLAGLAALEYVLVNHLAQHGDEPATISTLRDLFVPGFLHKPFENNFMIDLDGDGEDDCHEWCHGSHETDPDEDDDDDGVPDDKPPADGATRPHPAFVTPPQKQHEAVVTVNPVAPAMMEMQEIQPAKPEIHPAQPAKSDKIAIRFLSDTPPPMDQHTLAPEEGSPLSRDARRRRARARLDERMASMAGGGTATADGSGTGAGRGAEAPKKKTSPYTCVQLAHDVEIKARSLFFVIISLYFIITAATKPSNGCYD